MQRMSKECKEKFLKGEQALRLEPGINNAIPSDQLIKGGSTRWFCWENLFWVSDYIGHYEPFANFWRHFFGPGVDSDIFLPQPPTQIFRIFYFII